jgi:A/G-specific adenine glycosylase
LQQTTVAAITPRYVRFLGRFPSIQSLATADEHDVLVEWEGLGYYSRARNLHRAARIIANEHDGRLPNDPAIWSELPGVGRYILGAVLSQAFDRRLPIVEANTRRVLCRLFGQAGRPSSPSVNQWLWQAAEKILPHRRAGDFNQSLMELGALVCTPERPACAKCPLRSECWAFANGLQESIPLRTIRPKIETVREACLVLRNRQHVLVVRRPSTGRWANMWEFPRVVLETAETVEEGSKRLLMSLGIKARLGPELMTIRYAVTRFRMTMVCIEAKAAFRLFGSEYYKEGRWVRAGELSKLAVSSPQRKLAGTVQQRLEPDEYPNSSRQRQ